MSVGKKGIDDVMCVCELCVVGVMGEWMFVVCLGKFDVMYRGYFAFVERAATRGDVVVVLFLGMVEMLGWEMWLLIMVLSD